MLGFALAAMATAAPSIKADLALSDAQTGPAASSTACAF